MFALGGTSKAENSLYDESGAAYRQMVPKELRHDAARRSYRQSRPMEHSDIA